VVLGRRALIDGPTLVLFVGTLALVLFARRIPEPALVVAAGIAGIILQPSVV
jgi:chromate transporter